MSTIDTSTWNPDPALNESIGDIPLNESASIKQTWQAIQMLMAAGGLHGLQLVTFDGATASADGKQGLVPAPEAGDQDKILKGDGTWGTLSASDIPNIDASKIASGTIDLARLPAGALERLVTVADQTARYALTTASVQLGDTVKQLDTGVMYIVVDTSKLGQAAGYVEYTAGSAASVPWSGVTGKPSSYTPSSHTHGSITNDGKLGTASRVVVTESDKQIAVSSVTAAELGYLSGVTSAVQTQISSKADDSAVVHKTGNEGISGTKTFNSQIVGTVGKSVGNGAYADMIQTYQSDNGANRSCIIRCTNGDGFNEILIGAHDESNGAPVGLFIKNSDGVLSGSFNGSLRLTRITDAQGTQDNSPALSIGSTSGTHLELDGNEIMAKSSGTTTGPFYINAQGGDVYIGGGSENYKSVTGRGKGSSTVPVYTNADGIVTACGSSLDVDITGNAATATKLATPRTINGVSFDGSANITVEDSTKVSKSGDTMTGALNGRASNVNLSVEPTSAKEDWRFLITKSSADTTHTGNLMRLGVMQSANTKDYRITLGVSNPRAGNLPTQESIAGGTDDADASSSNCWGGIGVYYDYSKNRAYPYCYGLTTCDLSDNSSERLATNYWVRHATGNFACNAATATKLASPITINGVSFDGSANITVEDSAKLPAAGGVMTGEIVSSNGIVARRNDAVHILALYGGTEATNGGRLGLYGGARSANPGSFELTASIDSSTFTQLLGKPDGTLTWGGQSIQTSSDERLKTPLSSVPDAVLDAWEAVHWGQFQYLDAVERKGASARLHLGLIAQRVKSVFEERSLDACDYGILCYDKDEDMWTVRYAEALAMEAACQRRRADRLEARIKALEEAMR